MDVSVLESTIESDKITTSFPRLLIPSVDPSPVVTAESYIVLADAVLPVSVVTELASIIPEDKLSRRLISVVLVILSVTEILVPRLIIPCELYAVFNAATDPVISVMLLALIAVSYTHLRAHET